MTPAPPRWLLRLVSRVAPASIADDVAGDVVERWQRDARASRALAWRRALSLLCSLCWHAFRETSMTPTPFRSIPTFLAQSARFALRLWSRQPLTTALAILTLGLGIGASTALFSVVNAWLLRPLPFEDPDRLVVVWEVIPSAGVTENTPAPASLAAWEEQTSAFEGLAAWTLMTSNLSGAGDPARLTGVLASAELLPLLGARPLLGRGFDARDTVAGSDAVALLSHDVWQSRFGGARDIVGRRVTLDGRAVEIVGVLPSELPLLGFEYDVWRPLVIDRASESRMLWVFGRLKPGVTIEHASREVADIGTSRPGNGMAARVVPLHEQTVGPLGRDVLVLFAATGLVLLIACANVASLTLARVSARRQELLVRAALGAGRARVAAQVLTESAVLGLAGGLAGIAIAAWSVRAVVALAPQAERLAAVSVLDPRVFGFALAAATLTAAVFGAVPAWQAGSADLAPGMRAGGRGLAGGRRRFLKGLVAAEIALAFVLVAGAGLVLRTYVGLARTPLGFAPEGLVVADIPRDGADEAAAARGWTFYAGVEERLRASGAVRGVALSQALPLRSVGSMGGGFAIDGRTGDDASVLAYWRIVNDGYFAALGIPLTAGRAFTDSDREGAPAVAIVTESFAARAWPEGNAIGRRIGWGTLARPLTVVGVAADIRQSPASRPGPHVYMPYRQVPERLPSQLAVRADVSTAATIDLVRRVVRDLDPDQPVARITTGETLVARTLGRRRFQLTLVALFAGVAATLALVGIYGVLSFVVGQLRREVGIRLALGATPARARTLVLRQGGAMTAAGLAAGFVLAWWSSSLIEGFLVGVAPGDPATYASAALLLASAALAACLPAARRAGRVDPMIALRE